MSWMLLLLAMVPQAGNPSVRAWPGVCPQVCCSYNTDWTATVSASAFTEPGVTSDAGAPLFVVQAGESVRALTGTLFTIQPGSLEVNEHLSADATYGDFSERHRQMITLNAGEKRDVFAVRGNTIYRIAHKDTIVDANLQRVGTPDACARATPACVAVLTKPPIMQWWVMVMNARRDVGWIRDPRTFTVGRSCQ